MTISIYTTRETHDGILAYFRDTLGYKCDAISGYDCACAFLWIDITDKVIRGHAFLERSNNFITLEDFKKSEYNPNNKNMTRFLITYNADDTSMYNAVVDLLVAKGYRGVKAGMTGSFVLDITTRNVTSGGISIGHAVYDPNKEFDLIVRAIYTDPWTEIDLNDECKARVSADKAVVSYAKTPVVINKNDLLKLFAAVDKTKAFNPFIPGDVVIYTGCPQYRYTVRSASGPSGIVMKSSSGTVVHCHHSQLTMHEKAVQKRFNIAAPQGDNALNRAVQTLAFSYGYSWIGEPKNTYWFNNTSNTVGFSPETKQLFNECFANSRIPVKDMTKDLPEILDLLVTSSNPRPVFTPIVLKLENLSYDVVVSLNGVAVGCQTFPMSAITALREAFDKLNEKK